MKYLLKNNGVVFELPDDARLINYPEDLLVITHDKETADKFRKSTKNKLRRIIEIIKE